MEDLQIIKPMKKIIGMLDILICLLLFISALYKGGFYKEDSLFINTVICMLGLVCLSVKLVLNIVNNKKVVKSKTGTLIDICVMLMPIAYFLPVVFNKYASLESAIFESIRYVNLAIVYFIVRTTPNKKIYITSIILIGIALAILGIDEITYRGIEEILKPLSINYVTTSSGKISSTLQYANITALFMLVASLMVQNKLTINFQKLENKIDNRFRIIVILELFSLILLQSAIVLTTSRMNIFLMILTSFVQYIYCLKNGKPKVAKMLLLMMSAAILLVTSVESYLLCENYFMIWLTYIITLVLIVLAVITSTSSLLKIKIKNDSKRKIKNSKLKWLYALVIMVAIFILATIPDSLRLNNTSKEGNTITRNIYCNLQSEMDIALEISSKRNNVFRIEIFELDKDFNRNVVLSISQNNIENGIYTGKIKLSDTTIKLQFVLTVVDSDISIDSLKLGDKNITLSYKFAPDIIIFRLKDTLMSDSNNTLRFTYYLDALKLFNESKLVGIGGEGFKARYQQVQTESYVSSEAHSVPLQILVESGIIGFSVFTLLCVLTFIVTYRICKSKVQDSFMYFLIMFAFIMTALFDLVFSYGIMMYLFAILVGLIVGEYKNNNILEKDKYELDNKSSLGMLKIAVLSLSLMTLFIVTIYSVNIYRASIVIVPETKNDISTSYERVGLLEIKVGLDKYNLAYLNSLLAQYDSHIDLLNSIYILSQDAEEKEVLKNEINTYLIKQKDLADSIIECEYYNKYAIDKVARCYFKHYVSYSTIYNSNFKNDEIAYTFYVGYAIKLTDWITKIGPNNKVAQELAYYIYEDYLPVIEKQNGIINSEMLNQAIQDMKNKLEVLKEGIQ